MKKLISIKSLLLLLIFSSTIASAAKVTITNVSCLPLDKNGYPDPSHPCYWNVPSSGSTPLVFTGTTAANCGGFEGKFSISSDNPVDLKITASKSFNSIQGNLNKIQSPSAITVIYSWCPTDVTFDVEPSQ